MNREIERFEASRNKLFGNSFANHPLALGDANCQTGGACVCVCEVLPLSYPSVERRLGQLSSAVVVVVVAWS